MPTSASIRERLRNSLRRTRERLSLSGHDEPDWESLEDSLVLADVGLAATRRILEGVRSRGGDYRDALRSELVSMLERAYPASKSPPAGSSVKVTMVVGVNGVGKTTTVAKLAALASRSGERVLVIAADTFRAAAREQLEAWAGRIGVEIVSGPEGRDPASVVHEGLTRALQTGASEVFVDTAGRLHTKRPLMDELAKIGRVASRVVSGAPHETLLVMDATVGANGLAQAREFKNALDVTGIVLAKMDGTAKGGVVMAIAEELGVSVRYTGVGEGVDDLIAFSPGEFVDALLS